MNFEVNQKQVSSPVIDDETAKRFYRDAAWKLRKSKPSGIKPDFNSTDFRGVLAATSVFQTFPYDHDEEHHRLPPDPALVELHMDLGLTAIREQGARPLDKEFVAGYERIAGLVSDPNKATEAFIAAARREPSA